MNLNIIKMESGNNLNNLKYYNNININENIEEEEQQYLSNEEEDNNNEEENNFTISNKIMKNKFENESVYSEEIEDINEEKLYNSEENEEDNENINNNNNNNSNIYDNKIDKNYNNKKNYRKNNFIIYKTGIYNNLKEKDITYKQRNENFNNKIGHKIIDSNDNLNINIKDQNEKEKITENIKENESIKNLEKYYENYNLPLSISSKKNKTSDTEDEHDIILDKDKNEINQIESKENDYSQKENNIVENKENIMNLENKKHKEELSNNNLNQNDQIENKFIQKKENKDIKNINDKYNQSKRPYIKQIIKSHNNINKTNEVFKIPEGVKFGIDKTGNPIDIYQFLEEKKINEKNKNKIIAFIIQNENKNNYLVDTKGTILKKTDDDYYCYNEEDEFIIIKEFDIQHPELRVYGHRKMNFNINNNIRNIIDNNLLNKNNIIKELNKPDINNDINEINDIKNKSEIMKENIFKKIDIYRNIKTTDNNDFKEKMNLWRQRYGRKIDFDAFPRTETRNYSYRTNHEYKIINRTDSILKMASERDKDSIITRQSYRSQKIPINIKNNINNYLYYKNKLLKKNNLLDKNQKQLFEKKNNSTSKYKNNLSLNNYIKKNIIKNNDNNNFEKINSNVGRLYNFQGFQRNKSLENTYNLNIDSNSFSSRNIFIPDANYKIKDQLLQSIKQKYIDKEKNYNNLINNSLNEIKIDNINYENKRNIINDYIHDNLRKINENIYGKKNISVKCSILSNEANQIIKNFNKEHREKLHYINLDNYKINMIKNNSIHYLPINYNINKNIYSTNFNYS